MSDVLQCLKKHGQRLDLEIAEETRVPLAAVRERLSELSAAGAVVMCRLTRYEGATTIEAWQCRLSGYVPAPAPGRKPKAA
ncbi:MAG TPA: ArsR family transcriptional regulator [Casimicrobiaceae bacterium]